MSKQYIIDWSQQELVRQQLIEEKKKLDAGYISPEEWTRLIWEILSGYIKHEYSGISQIAINKGIERDEFINTCYIAVAEAAGKYDPEKCLPTTFFGPYIKNVKCSYYRDGNMSIHYNKEYKRINKLLIEAGFPDGIESAGLDTSTVAVITNSSEKTVRECMEQAHITVSSLDEMEGGTSIESTVFRNPEEYVIRNENAKILAGALKRNMSPFESYLCSISYDANNHPNWLAVAKHIKANIDEFKREFGDELPARITKLSLQARYNQCMGRVRRDRDVAGDFSEFSRNESSAGTSGEQATVEDITEAFVDGLFEDVF